MNFMPAIQCKFGEGHTDHCVTSTTLGNLAFGKWGVSLPYLVDTYSIARQYTKNTKNSLICYSYVSTMRLKGFSLPLRYSISLVPLCNYSNDWRRVHFPQRSKADLPLRYKEKLQLHRWLHFSDKRVDEWSHYLKKTAFCFLKISQKTSFVISRKHIAEIIAETPWNIVILY